MIAFDPTGKKYGVGTDGNIGHWVDMQWVDSGYDGWTVDMLTFDFSGRAWCVGTQGNIGGWNYPGWVDLGHFTGGWDMAWLLWADVEVTLWR